MGLSELTEEQQQEARQFYEGSIPSESIKLTPEKSGLYSGMSVPDEEVKIPNLGLFLLNKLHTAHNEGHVGKTALHYAAQLEEADALDSRSLARLRLLAQDAYDNRHDDQALEISNKRLREFVGTFRAIRRPE